MSEPREPLRLVHHHPGRLRVRADVFLGSADAFKRVSEALDAVAGISAVSHNPGTGSVLVEYEPGLAEPDTIVERVARAAGLGEVIDDATARAQRTDPAATVVRAVRAVDEVVRAIGSEGAGLPVVVPAALASAAVLSLAMMDRKDMMPRWDNLLWWSYSIFKDWNARPIMRVPRDREGP